MRKNQFKRLKNVLIKFVFSKKATKMKKSSQSIWHLLHKDKSTVKISSIFVAFLENMNFMNDPLHPFFKLCP